MQAAADVHQLKNKWQTNSVINGAREMDFGLYDGSKDDETMVLIWCMYLNNLRYRVYFLWNRAFQN